MRIATSPLQFIYFSLSGGKATEAHPLDIAEMIVASPYELAIGAQHVVYAIQMVVHLED